ncbi:MAG: hypothetical protein O3A01_00190 [bacterium]|nr:hypothetical protein [bacterium]
MKIKSLILNKMVLTYALILSGFTALLLFVVHPPNIVDLKITPFNKPDYSFQNVTISLIEDGNPTWEIDAQYAAIDKKKALTTLQTVTGNIFSNDSKKVFHFTSPVSTYHLNKQEMKINLPETIIYAAQDPIYLSCDTITWSPQKNTLEGVGNIITRYKNTVMKSRKFSAELPIKNIAFSGKASMTINLD